MAGHQLAVGELYNPARRSYPTKEEVRLGRNIHELVRFWPAPSPDEVAAHESGAAQFALVDEAPHLLVLAYQYATLDWSDSPFQIHRSTTDHQAWPMGGAGSGILFRTVLVDAESGVIRSMRYDKWSAEFSNAVRISVAEQLLYEFDDDAAAQRLAALYDEHRTPAELVRSRATAGCATDGPVIGGDARISMHYY